MTLKGQNPTVHAGSSKQFIVRAERYDNFNGPIRVEISGLPAGFSATSPVIIQAGHLEAYGVISAAEDAVAPTKENAAKTKVVATAAILGKTVSKKVNHLGAIKFKGKPKILVTLEPSSSGGAPSSLSRKEITIAPGSTITFRLKIQRNDFEDLIKFDLNNLPHGVIVDNIGLSGVMIPAGKTQRTIFLTAADWVPNTSRLFHAVAKADDNQTSLPLLLHVRSGEKTTQK